jgi:hypothetical protein
MMAKRALVTPLLFSAVIALAAGTTSHAQRGTFSLDVQFRDATDPADVVRSDGGGTGRDGVYADFADPSGRAPAVYADGNITIDLRGSTRTMQFQFGPGAAAVRLPLISSAVALPVSGSYPVIVQSLTSTYGGITDLAPGSENTYSIVFYWSGPGADNRTHDYNLAFRQRIPASGGVRAIASDTGASWSIEPLTGVARLSGHASGKGGGWIELADVDAPFHLVARRHDPNLRGGNRK